MCVICGGLIVIVDDIYGSRHLCLSCEHSVYIPHRTLNDLDPKWLENRLRELEKDVKNKNQNQKQKNIIGIFHKLFTQAEEMATLGFSEDAGAILSAANEFVENAREKKMINMSLGQILAEIMTEPSGRTPMIR